jgi:signal transduction histidine kinase
MLVLALLSAAVPITRPRHMILVGVVAPLVLLVLAVALAFAYVMPPMLGPMLALGLPSTGLGVLRWAQERAHGTYVENLDFAQQQHIDMLVHDLKNTVSPIVMSLPMIGLGKRRSERVDEAFLHEDFPEIVFTSASKLMTQINALLDIRRLQQGRMRLKPEPCSPRELLERTKEECEIPISRAELRLEVVHQAAGDIRIRVDPAVFDRVLGNVIWNAVNYAAQASTIRLGSRLADDGRLCIYVANQGKAITEEVKGSLFSAFMTGPGSEKVRGRIPSTGLGLTFCKLALEAHCGEIDLLSPAPDSEGGVEVRLLIPICDTSAD